MDKDTLITVKARTRGRLGYTIPEDNILREFSKGESKQIPFGELVKLSYIPGGDYILKNSLIVENQEALDLLNMHVEPEYFYTEKEVKKLLSEGSLDQVEDTLNFGPEGVKELIIQTAVDTKLPDTNKRKIIQEHTEFNVDQAIAINEALGKDEEENKSEEKKRKSTPLSVGNSQPARKAAVPQYNVVSKNKE